MLKELYLAQKKFKNGMSINDLHQKTSIADYDKIKKILYVLETASIY